MLSVYNHVYNAVYTNENTSEKIIDMTEGVGTFIFDAFGGEEVQLAWV